MPFRSGEKNGEAPERGGGLFCSDRRGAGGLVHRESCEYAGLTPAALGSVSHITGTPMSPEDRVKSGKRSKNHQGSHSKAIGHFEHRAINFQSIGFHAPADFIHTDEDHSDHC